MYTQRARQKQNESVIHRTEIWKNINNVYQNFISGYPWVLGLRLFLPLLVNLISTTVMCHRDYNKSMWKQTVWYNAVENRMEIKLNFYWKCCPWTFCPSQICLLLLACDLIAYRNDCDLLVIVVGSGCYLLVSPGTLRDSVLRKCSQSGERKDSQLCPRPWLNPGKTAGAVARPLGLEPRASREEAVNYSELLGLDFRNWVVAVTPLPLEAHWFPCPGRSAELSGWQTAHRYSWPHPAPHPGKLCAVLL